MSHKFIRFLSGLQHKSGDARVREKFSFLFNSMVITFSDVIDKETLGEGFVV